jgi:hypothetical protein
MKDMKSMKIPKGRCRVFSPFMLFVLFMVEKSRLSGCPRWAGATDRSNYISKRNL